MKFFRGLVCFLVASVSLWAWDKTGHRAIALVAYDHLNPLVREQVDALLQEHPHYTTLLREDLFDLDPQPPRLVFANSGKWADDVRNPPFKDTFNHSMWHFVDLPYVPEKYAESIHEKDIPEAGEILSAIAANSKLLRDRSLKPADRAIALCWLVHLVADIHQPLHGTGMFTPELPKGDMGGNLLFVRRTLADEKPTNVHWLWDEAMSGEDRTLQGAEALAKNLEQTYPSLDELPGVLTHTTPRSWAEESHDWAIRYVYLNGQLPFAIKTGDQPPALDDCPVVPEGYLSEARHVSQLRAAQAAERLAVLLNRLLAR